MLLAISASSSDSGAGSQMDLKTASALGVYCASVITCITAQNTRKVSSAFNLPVKEVEKQIDAVLSDFSVKVVKIGLIGDEKNFGMIAKKLRKKKIVLDPVLSSQSDGKKFGGEKHARAMGKFLPNVFLIAVNSEESERLCKVRIKDEKSAAKAASLLKNMGVKNVLVKGVRKEKEKAICDFLFAGKNVLEFRKPLVKKGTHGGGCLLSTAIAANLEKGMDLAGAVGEAEMFAAKSIAGGMKLGRGIEIVNPFYSFTPKV